MERWNPIYNIIIVTVIKFHFLFVIDYFLCINKVGFGDVLDREGSETEAQFASEFSKDRVFFQRCDITSNRQLKVSLTISDND